MIRKIIAVIFILIIIVAVALALWVYYFWSTDSSSVPTLVNSLSEKIDHPLMVLSDLAGYDSAKTYLVIMQNNHELRPSGGFIGVYGILKIRDGQIVSLDIDDSYALDRLAESYLEVEPPVAIKKYLADKWFFRDANWSVDFPTSAEKLIWFYGEEGGLEGIDGVIAFDPDFIASLLKVVGPLEALGEEFKAENFTDKLEYEVEMNYRERGISKTERKAVVGLLAGQLIDKVKQLPALSWFKVLNQVEQNLTAKHLLIYSKDPAIQKVLVANGWAGAVKPAANDYLLVADANMVALKTDRVVDKQINYLVQENQNGELIAIVTLHYTNNGDYDYRTSRLRSYTRIYVPEGSELIAVQGAMSNDRGENPGTEGTVDVYQELNKTAFGAFWYINPGESKSLIFEYKLPARIKSAFTQEEVYTLFVQKQPGTTGHQFNFKLKLDDLEKQLETDLAVDRSINIRN